MKFYIDKGTEIFLFQVLKAAGLIPNYEEVREAVQTEKVKVNGKICTNQREVLGNGDKVEYADKIAEIVGRGVTGKGKKLIEEKPSFERIPTIEHGKVNKWSAKPVNIEKRLDTKISETMQKLHNTLIKKELTLAFAESCTGGMLQDIVVSLSGCSAYFLGGITAYANSIKQRVLEVNPDTLAQFGAVSKEVAKEMVLGLEKTFQANISAITTGLAGPDGGTKEKPVGSVYTAIKIGDKIIENHYNFSGNRNVIRKKTTLEILQTIAANL